MKKFKAVLFDLDGTLVDTAPDLAYALNQLRKENHLPPLPLDLIRQYAGLGSKPLIKLGFEIEETHADFSFLVKKFLTLYEENLVMYSKLFDGMLSILDSLDQKNIPWGIVTNKLTVHAKPLLKKLNIFYRAQIVVCGDTLPTFKPDPAPLLFAREKMNTRLEDCVFIGDSSVDAQAGKNAKMHTIIVRYGYIRPDEDPEKWGVDQVVHTIDDLKKVIL